MKIPIIADETLSELAAAVQSGIADSLLDVAYAYGELTITVKREDIVKVLSLIHI